MDFMLFPIKYKGIYTQSSDAQAIFTAKVGIYVELFLPLVELPKF